MSIRPDRTYLNPLQDHAPHPFCSPELCTTLGADRHHQQSPRLLCLDDPDPEPGYAHDPAADEELRGQPPVAWWLEQDNEVDEGEMDCVPGFPPVLVLAVGTEQVRLPLRVAARFAAGVAFTATMEAVGIQDWVQRSLSALGELSPVARRAG